MVRLSTGRGRRSPTRPWLEALEERRLLSGVAPIPYAPPPGPGGVQVQAPAIVLGGQVRKDQSTLTGQEKQDFVDAVKQLKVTFNPGSDLSVYDEFVQAHHDAFAGGHAHAGAAFLPWHREFLREFEQALQTVNPNVTIPYWRFDVDDSFTSSLWNPDFLGGNGDPDDNHIVKDGPFRQGQWTLLYDGPDLRRDFGGGFLHLDLPQTSDVEALFGIRQYDVFPYDVGSELNKSFRNSMEGFNYPSGAPELHNRVHVWVGGSMAIQDSPQDPVFWMLHANLDRLWAEWENRYGLQYEPEQGGRPGQNLHDAMFPFGAVTPADVLDHWGLGYRYDTEPPFGLTVGPGNGPGAPGPGTGGRGGNRPARAPAFSGADVLAAGHAGHAGLPDATVALLGALAGGDGPAGDHGGHTPSGPAAGGLTDPMTPMGFMAPGGVHAGTGGAERFTGACT
jgi:tyrosinase